MPPKKRSLDPAVDVVRGAGGVKFCVPGGSFAVRDPHGVAAALSLAWAGGAEAPPTAGLSADQLAEATEQLSSYLSARRVLLSEEGTSRDFDPAREWLRHYAGAADQDVLSVELVGDGHLSSRLRGHFASIGIDASGRCAPRCILAAYDTPDFTALRAANVRAHDLEVPYLPAWMERSSVFWGPMTLPGGTGCLECRLHRSHANKGRSDDLHSYDLKSISSSALIAEMAAGFVSGELIKWALDAHVESDVGVGWRYDWLSNEISGRRVLRLPRCPVCGSGRGK